MNLINKDKPVYYCRVGHCWQFDQDGKQIFVGWWNELPETITATAIKRYCGCQDYALDGYRKMDQYE